MVLAPSFSLVLGTVGPGESFEALVQRGFPSPQWVTVKKMTHMESICMPSSPPEGVNFGHSQVVMLWGHGGFVDWAPLGVTPELPGIGQVSSFLEHLRYVSSFKLWLAFVLCFNIDFPCILTRNWTTKITPKCPRSRFHIVLCYTAMLQSGLQINTDVMLLSGHLFGKENRIFISTSKPSGTLTLQKKLMRSRIG